LSELILALPSLVSDYQSRVDAAEILSRHLTEEQSSRLRHDVGESRRVRELMARARQKLANSIQQSSLERLAEEFANKTSGFSKDQLRRQTVAAMGVSTVMREPSLVRLTENFVSQNVSLITSIPEKLFADVESTVLRGFQSGKRSVALARDIEDRFEVSETRAKLIATDQIGSLYAQINATRQRSIGVKR